MNNKKFFESFKFRVFLFDKDRHTDNYSNNGLRLNYIVYLVKGSAKIVLSDRSFYLRAGDFFYIPKDCPYYSYWHTDGNSRLEWYSIGFDCIPLPNGGNFIMQKLEVTGEAKALFDKMAQKLTVSMESVGLLYLFIGKIVDGMKMEGKPYEASVEKALGYMRSNTNAKMGEVAMFCNISEATLFSLFKKRFKKTPNEIRQKILCEKAEELLITTSLSVEEISGKLGFSSASYFRKILKKHLNTTPTSIRKSSV
ncbi:MAG: helix-turn-helix transcriptional regulator [Clostridia bacterium]|nr:helix-turn-helix transcriptional regulator [Clostridia bacterium]